jgi:N-acetylglucosamine-6-phosphate deacetylase
MEDLPYDRQSGRTFAKGRNMDINVRRLSNNVTIRGGELCVPDRTGVQNVLIQQGKFVSALGASETVVDAAGLFVTPGLIDIQVNGCAGHEFSEGDRAVAVAQELLPQYGITAFLPTTGSQPIDLYRSGMFQGVMQQARGRAGAEVLGWHLEGPFINPEQAGIHPATRLLTSLDTPMWKELFQSGAIRVMTLAPEHPRAEPLFDLLAECGVIAAIGHSSAEEKDLLLAEKGGARYITHLFNAMKPFHHRSPGLIGAALGSARFSCTMVCDLNHLCREALQMAWKCHPEGVCIVTDGAPLLGSEERSGMFLGTPVHVVGEKLLTPNGNLAGSIVPLDEQVRRFMNATGCGFTMAVRAASLLPARFVHCDDRKGKIEAGCDADCVLWDRALHVVATICRGEIVYARSDFWSRVHQ